MTRRLQDWAPCEHVGATCRASESRSMLMNGLGTAESAVALVPFANRSLYELKHFSTLWKSVIASWVTRWRSITLHCLSAFPIVSILNTFLNHQSLKHICRSEDLFNGARSYSAIQVRGKVEKAIAIASSPIVVHLISNSPVVAIHLRLCLLQVKVFLLECDAKWTDRLTVSNPWRGFVSWNERGLFQHQCIFNRKQASF